MTYTQAGDILDILEVEYERVWWVDFINGLCEWLDNLIGRV